ncbi:MAG: alpha/beta hydrolase [Proteobacteria bacterium]|nr:alpha/beta hydrolase [Pseudomonadota bacterium]
MSVTATHDVSGHIGVLGKFIEVVPGVELHYWDVGEGTPLLFVPGWTFTADVFVHQLKGLSEDHRVIAIDPRSQGRSTTTAGGNEYATHSADLKTFIEALDLNDVVLIGWSAGAAETWGYVRLAGLDRVKAHVCIDLPPRCLSRNEDTDWVEGTLTDISGAVMTMTTRATLREFVKYYAENVMVQRELSPEDLDWIIGQSERTPDWAALSLFSYLMFTDYQPEVTLLDGNRPSLFVIAEGWADKAKPYIQKRWNNTRIEVLGGHMMFWEHPEPFNAIIRRFLADI